MNRLPAPLLRGLAVLGLGATLVASHVAFAAGALSARSADRSSAPSSVASLNRKIAEAALAIAPAENCYLDTQVDVTASGKQTVRLVQECD